MNKELREWRYNEQVQYISNWNFREIIQKVNDLEFAQFMNDTKFQIQKAQKIQVRLNENTLE